MTMYSRGGSKELEVIDEWDRGVGWLAYPDEDGERASHAVVGDDGGIWVIDPIDAPGVDELLADLGEVVGVAVLSNYHARDAGAIAERHGVSIHLPEWMDRVEERIKEDESERERSDREDVPIERYTKQLGDSGFRIKQCSLGLGTQEAVAYRQSDSTIYIADMLGTLPFATVGEERIGVYLTMRLFPPHETFGEYTPERIIVGHGPGILEDADVALTDALDGARRGFPRALLSSRKQIRAGVAALVDEC